MGDAIFAWERLLLWPHSEAVKDQSNRVDGATLAPCDDAGAVPNATPSHAVDATPSPRRDAITDCPTKRTRAGLCSSDT